MKKTIEYALIVVLCLGIILSIIIPRIIKSNEKNSNTTNNNVSNENIPEKGKNSPLSEADEIERNLCENFLEHIKNIEVNINFDKMEVGDEIKISMEEFINQYNIYIDLTEYDKYECDYNKSYVSFEKDSDQIIKGIYLSCDFTK